MTVRRAIDQYQANEKDKLIIKYMPLVQKIAGKMMLYSYGLLDKDDLISLGFVGLLHAVEKYDPARGNKFESFAAARIRGAILDELRALSWRPRSVMDKIKRVIAAQDKLAAQGVDYTDEDVARELDEPLESVQKTIAQFNASVILSFDEVMFEEDSGYSRYEYVPDPGGIDPGEQVVKKEKKALLVQAVKELPEREQQILALYYQEDLTLKQIGKVMNISEGRVCQIHARAIAKLRKQLQRQVGE